LLTLVPGELLMAALHLQQIFRMEKVIARLRVAVVLLAGAELLHAPSHLVSGYWMLALWGASLAYALGTLMIEPYRRIPLAAWDVASALIDCSSITIGIVATGGERSALYLLYFLAVLSRAMRFGLRKVVITGCGTAVGYIAIVMLTSSDWNVPLQDAAFRMGYLMIFAVGSGVLAREVKRQFRARLTEEAQRLALQEVTATVSHDLMNPLAAVAGLVEMLLDSAAERLSFDQQETLHRVNANAQQMTNLVSNLLDAELIGRGHQSFRPAPVELNVLVRRVVEAQAHQAELKHIGLVLDLSNRLPVAMLDGRMIERLVANLLGNAVKFTPENGAIRVSTRQRGARLSVEVWDSGPQVPDALQRVLFEKFARQKDSPGVGLGLYICKSIVDAHSGEIFVRKAAEGVSFVAEFPLERSRTGSRSASQATAAQTPFRQAWQPDRRLIVIARG